MLFKIFCVKKVHEPYVLHRVAILHVRGDISELLRLGDKFEYVAGVADEEGLLVGRGAHDRVTGGQPMP